MLKYKRLYTTFNWKKSKACGLANVPWCYLNKQIELGKL